MTITLAERDALAVKWLGLPLKVYGKMTHLSTVRKMGGDDAKGAGALALLRAAETWDPNRGVPFQSYASFLIRNEILSSAIEHHSGPTRMPRTCNKNRSEEASLLRKNACRVPVSLSYNGEYEGLADTRNYHDFREERKLPEEAKILKLLEPVQRRILEMKLINGMTFREITDNLENKYSEGAVRWQYQKAVKLLRDAYVSYGYGKKSPSCSACE